MHRLTIEKTNGSCVSICGTEDVLSAELEAWEKFEKRSTDQEADAAESGQEHYEREQYYVRKVHGLANDASRSEVIIAYRFYDVIGMALVEL